MKTYILNTPSDRKKFENDHQHAKKMLGMENGKLIVHIFQNGDIEIFKFPSKGKSTLIMFEEEQENVVDPNSYVMPALYGVDKKGKERIWKVWALKNVVYKVHGEVGGKLTPATRKIKGVNKGKKNETSDEEQTKIEAEREWIKQLEKDYHPKCKEGISLEKKVNKAKQKQGGVTVDVSKVIRGDTLAPKKSKTTKSKDNGVVPGYESKFKPMHCQTWSDEAKVLKYFDFDEGVYIQPKLDGVRCLARIMPEGVVLLSRQGKQMVWLNHLRREVEAFLERYEHVMLDCEVYVDHIYGKCEYKSKKKIYSEGKEELSQDQKFDVISGAARPVRLEPHPLEEQMCLYVFDIADETGEMDQDDRFQLLKDLFSRPQAKKCKHIIMNETKVIYYQEEIKDYHDEAALNGFEGVVIRSRDLKYESQKRSNKMRKYKYFIDAEYPIIDVERDEGVDREHFVWVCEALVENSEGETSLKTFKAKPKGSREQKWEWYDNADDYIGKLLTVKFQQYTVDEVPRFPVGISIRDYE
jgi:ATP-dependent DNA ligase